MRELNQPLEDLKDKYLNQESLQIWKDLDIMKLLLKSTKENYNKGEKQEEGNLNYYFKVILFYLIINKWVDQKN